MALVFSALHVLCGLTCLLYFCLEPGVYSKWACVHIHTLLTTMAVIKIDFLNSATSQGFCELPNLILISNTAPVPVVSLNQPLCFGFVFPNTIPIPLGTEWEVISNSNVTLLANDMDGVTLSLTPTEQFCLAHRPTFWALTHPNFTAHLTATCVHVCKYCVGGVAGIAMVKSLCSLPTGQFKSH